jgi:hypothetical protein
MKKEQLVEQYLRTIAGIDLSCETIEGTLVLVKEGMYHLYIRDNDDMLFIGTGDQDDLAVVMRIRTFIPYILDIYNNSNV